MLRNRSVVIGRVISSIIAVTLFLFFVITPVVSQAETEKTKTVKVGYIDYKGMIEKDDKGNYLGYGVEYLNEISKYTGWNYEYVYDTWDNQLNNLKSGKIDLIFHAQHSEERDKEFDFSKYSVGVESSLVYVNKTNTTYNFGDYSNFSGMKVGLLANSYQNQTFDAFARENDFTYKSKSYKTDSQAFRALRNGEVDSVAVGSLSAKEGVRIVARFGADPYFVMTKNGREDILGPLNEALDTIKTTNMDLEEELYKKYYQESEAASQVILTKEEKE